MNAASEEPDQSPLIQETRVHQLMESVARSPFSVAPERRDALLAIQKRHGVELVVSNGIEITFNFRAVFGQIYTSIRSLQHIWASACLYSCLYNERLFAHARNETEVPFDENPRISGAIFYYEASCVCFAESMYFRWPDDISEFSPEAGYIDMADELFRLMCSFAILHEVAHFELGHNKVNEASSEQEEIDCSKIELDADKWAYDWILVSWRDYGNDPRIFTKRTLGIIFALTMTAEFPFLSKNLDTSHPSAIDRLDQFIRDYGEEIRRNEWGTTCFGAISIALQMVAIRNVAPISTGPFEGIAEFLAAARVILHNN